MAILNHGAHRSVGSSNVSNELEMKSYFLRSSDLAYQLMFVAPTLMVGLPSSLEMRLLTSMLGDYLAIKSTRLQQTFPRHYHLSVFPPCAAQCDDLHHGSRHCTHPILPPTSSWDLTYLSVGHTQLPSLLVGRLLAISGGGQYGVAT